MDDKNDIKLTFTILYHFFILLTICSVSFSARYGETPLYQPNGTINLSKYFDIFTAFDLRRYYRRSLAG